MNKRIPFCHRVSKLFQPTNVVPIGAQVKSNDLLSKSYKLMIDEGVVASSQNGFYYFLPLAMRSLEKLSKLVDRSMLELGAQKISCPALTGSNIWEKTGRISLAGSELFQLKDRHGKKFILSPTHEEAVTNLLATLPPLSYKQLPLLLYQTTVKFRDEARPRFGLIRSREFLMKDLYSFDVSCEAAQVTYQAVAQAYHKIFDAIGVNYVKVKGISGLMGGNVSHEFHFPAEIGDDTLHICRGCGQGWNQENNLEVKCQHCKSDDITTTKGIEVGHMFQLDTRYSEPLQALCNTPEGKRPLVMCSYGLGLSRILAACLEVLSSADHIRWPANLSPYSVIIITPKQGSKESNTVEHMPEELYWRLQGVPELEGDVLIDDRAQLTIGKRLFDAQRKGYPYVAVVGKEAAAQNALIELHSITSGEVALLTQDELISVLVGSTQRLRAKASSVQ